MKPMSKFNLSVELSYYYDDEDADKLNIEKACNLSFEDIYAAWQNYSYAMARKRPDSILPWDAFYNYICWGDVYLVRYENSIIFGQIYMLNDMEVFIPSHFAPYGIREGYHLMGLLLNINCVLMVPEDLSVMAEKIGFHKVASNIPMTFRDNVCYKNILVSNCNIKKAFSNFSLEDFLNV